MEYPSETVKRCETCRARTFVHNMHVFCPALAKRDTVYYHVQQNVHNPERTHSRRDYMHGIAYCIGGLKFANGCVCKLMGLLANFM
jgi:hypothetical protein